MASPPITAAAQATEAKDWAQFYSDSRLKGLGLPVYRHISPADGAFRSPYLKAGEIKAALRGVKAPTVMLLCCDVLLVDTELSFAQPVYIYARRIEVAKGGSLTLDRSDTSDAELVLVAQEIVSAADNKPAGLTFSLIFLDARGQPQEADQTVRAIYGLAGPKAVQLVAGKSALATVLPEDMVEVFLRQGEQLPLCLNTQFLLACLHFDQEPAYVRPLLVWITGLLAASTSFSELSLQARSLHDTVVHLAQGGASLVVPTLDHAVYAESAKACMTLLEQREARRRQLDSIRKEDANWEASVVTALADKQNEVDLNRQLEKQAQATRDSTARARALAMVELVTENDAMVLRRSTFELGVEAWKRKQTRKAIFDLVSNSVALLGELPTILAAGPELAALPAVQSAIDLGQFLAEVSSGKANDPTPDALKDWGKAARASIAAAPDRLRSFMARRTQASRAARRNANDQDDANDDDLVLPAVPAGDPVDATSDALIGEFARGNMSQADRAAADAWIKGEEALRADAEKARAARAAKQAKLMASLKAASGDVKGIVDAAMRLNSIAAIAEQMEATSTAILTSVDANVGVSLGGIAPVDIDVVTGGSQVWEQLAIEIENLFETLGGGVLTTIAGGGDYRQAFRRLVAKGRAMSEARLALAKANTDLAATKLRRQSAESALQLFRDRAAELHKEVLQDDALKNAAFERVIEAKRGIFLAMEAYCRAFAYFTLLPRRRWPALPRITDSVDDFAKAVAGIAGKRLELDTLTQLGLVPSTLDGVSVVFNDPALLAAIRNGETLIRVAISPGIAAFRLMRRVRVKSVGIFLDGLKTKETVAVRFCSSGVYRDKAEVGDTGSDGLSFVAEPWNKLFEYDPGTTGPLALADVVQRYADDFFQPTPFTDWSFSITTGDGKPLDLAGLTAVRFKFAGAFSP